MIILTKLNGKDLMINEANIENVAETPDTVITMTNGHNYIVQESIKDIYSKIIAFNRACKARMREPGHKEG